MQKLNVLKVGQTRGLEFELSVQIRQLRELQPALIIVDNVLLVNHELVEQVLLHQQVSYLLRVSGLVLVSAHLPQILELCAFLFEPVDLLNEVGHYVGVLNLVARLELLQVIADVLEHAFDFPHFFDVILEAELDEGGLVLVESPLYEIVLERVDFVLHLLIVVLECQDLVHDGFGLAIDVVLDFDGFDNHGRVSRHLFF